MYVVVGRQMNIYTAHLGPITPIAGSASISTSAFGVPGSAPYVFSFESTSGTLRNSSFRWTPASTDSTPSLKITAYDYAGKVLDTANTVMKPIAATSGTGKKKTLFIGDSFFDNGGPDIIAEVDSLFSHSGGGDILPIGTQIDNGYRHESHSGKDWSYFVDNPNGPFWKSGRLNFKQYMTDAGLTGDIELVCINLGGNDAFDFASRYNRAMTSADVDTAVIELAKALIDTLQSATYGYPNAQVVLNIMPAPSAWASSFGKSYGQGNNGLYIDYQKSMREIAKATIAAFDNGAYDRHVDVCYGGAWLDNIRGYPTETISPAASRITDYELRGTNWLHPALDGNYQIADALYSHLKYAVTKIDAEPVVACTNELVNSYSLNPASGWTVNASWHTATGGQADPWGYNHGQLIDAVVASAGAAITATAVTVPSGNAVVSAVFKNVDRTTTEGSRVTFRNTAGGVVLAQGDITWAATPTFARDGTVDTGGGIQDLTGGWYRVWVSLDLTTVEGASCTAQIYPFFDGTVVAGDSVIFGGAQLEYGVTEPCGDYVEKP